MLSVCAVAHGPFAQGGNTLVWYSIAGMLSASFGASMLPVAKFAWEKLEFILAPSQDREQQQQVSSASSCHMLPYGIEPKSWYRDEEAASLCLAVSTYRKPFLAQSCRLWDLGNDAESAADAKPTFLQEQVLLYNVDVTCSRYLSRPGVLRAAHFAAMAHEGQVCPALKQPALFVELPAHQTIL